MLSLRRIGYSMFAARLFSDEPFASSGRGWSTSLRGSFLAHKFGKNMEGKGFLSGDKQGVPTLQGMLMMIQGVGSV
jgi:hypothetical protein